MGTRVKIASLAVLAVVLVATSGCVGGVTPGAVRTEEEIVELQGADSAQVTVAMGAGELQMSGGAAELLNAAFTYNIDEWQPEVSYAVNGGRGELVVAQPDVTIPNSGNVEYVWDLQLASGVPIDLAVSLGAGQSNLDLSQVNLTGLNVEVGAGEGIVILTGDYDESFDASIQGGVGSATVLLSNSVGVRVQATGGLGSINAPGFTQDGSVYTNDAYGESDVTLNVDIEGGVGEITIQLVD